MPQSLLGTQVRRVEDPDLLTGRALFVADLPIESVCHARFVRSPFAHANIRSVDIEAARKNPGVLEVFVAETINIAPFHPFLSLNPACVRPPLAQGRVRFVGEPVAMVIAETAALADDASELVVVDYEPLPSVTDPEAAVATGAPIQFDDLGTNIVAGNIWPASKDPFEDATRVVRARFENQRLAAAPMEGDVIIAVPSTSDTEYDLTVYLSTQMPHGSANTLARVLDLDRARLRLVTPHVGGAFGGKPAVTSEHAAVVKASLLCGRPIRYVQTREENLVSMHGRGQIQWVEAGFADDNRLTGLRCSVLADAGAYAGFGGGLALGPTRIMSQGVYRVPSIEYRAAAVVTNTAPMGAFRGAGRPEATAMLERMMDVAAVELGVDPVELRRVNLLPPFDDPVATVTGIAYDSGDYGAVLDELLQRADYGGLRGEQARRRDSDDPHQIGIGVAVYVEVTAGGGGSEFGAVEVHHDGTATIRAGTSAHGQGHATALSMIASDLLGIPMSSVRFIQSDTALVPRGGGTGGSRSLQMAGSAVQRAAEEVLLRARKIVANELEATVDDIVVHDSGRLGVAGVPSRAFSWPEILNLASGSLGLLDPENPISENPLSAEIDFSQDSGTFPFGAHLSVVEVDTETGYVRPLRHVAVDDCGRILNPLLVTGQQHGGIAQGIAQALYEEVVYDDEGNPLTTSFAEYEIPSAAELPNFESSNTMTPTLANPLGAKGIGESGTIGALAATHNAVVDALSYLGVRHIAMPCTPERVWRSTLDVAGSPDRSVGGSLLWTDPPSVFAQLPVFDPDSLPEAASADI